LCSIATDGRPCNTAWLLKTGGAPSPAIGDRGGAAGA
jgi:hypothetical protein